jgi:hypothetical protein
MSTEVDSPSTTEGAPESTPQTTEAPTDFREYVRWRETGELPQKDEAPPAAAAAEEPPPAKSEPQSGAEESQQPEDEDEEHEPEKPGRGSSRQRKIDRLTRELEMAKAQLAVLQPKPAQTEPPKPAEPPGKPKLENFKTLEEYQEALTDWKLDQREAQRAAKSAEEATQTAWSSSENTARAAHADYDEVVKSVKAPEGPGVLAARQAMLDEPLGAEILYHLATHPEELEAIAAMPPVRAVMAIGRLSAKLAVPPVAATKPQVTSAPKPPPALSRPAKTVTQNVNDENFARSDYKAWAKLREAQLRDR